MTMVNQQGMGLAISTVLCLGLIAVSSDARAQTGPDYAPTSDMQTSSDPQSPSTLRDRRGGAAFGIVSGSGLFVLSTSFIVTLATNKFVVSDKDLLIATGIPLAIAPALGVGLAHLVTRKSRLYNSPLLAMMIGAYSGAALSYLGYYFYLRSDDPKADGQYEGGYFNDNAQGVRRFGGFMLGFLLPIITPAMGTFLGYLAGRRLKSKHEAVSFSPPTPIVFKSTDKYRRSTYSIGVNLVRMTF